MGQTQSESTKKSGRKNQVYGFIVDMLDSDVMASYIKENALDIDLELTPNEIAGQLSAHFLEKAETLAKEEKTDAEEQKVRCEECSGISTLDCTTCPFCGDAGGVEDPVEAKAETETTKDEGASEDEGEESDDEDETEEESDEEEESDDDEGESDEEESDEEEEPQPTPKKSSAKAKATAKDKEKKNMGAAGEVNGVSTSKAVTKASSSHLSAKDLDKAISEVRKLQGSGAEIMWELGKKLAEINKKQLWKLRTDDNGKAKYKGFDAFVHSEIGMSVQHAYNAIELAKNYSDASEIRELGQTKALMLLKAAPEDRPSLKKKVKEGATKKHLAADVKKSRESKGSPNKSQQAKAGAKGAKAKAKKSAVVAEKVSISSIEGSKSIKLFKRPDSLRDLDWSALPRAKKIGDVPFGKLVLATGVVQYFSVLEKDGELMLKIETRRAKEE